MIPLKTLVKFRLGGLKGQVVRAYSDQITGWNHHTPVYSKMDYDKKNKEFYKRTGFVWHYEVRLEGGMIIRELRDWELEVMNNG